MKKTGSLLQSHNYHTARCNLRLVLNDPRTRSPGYFKAAVNFLDMVLVLYFLFLFLRRVLFLWFVRQLQAWLTRNSHAHTPVPGSAHKHSAWSGISSSRADKQENRKTCVNTYRSAYERRHSFRGSYSCSNRSFLCCLWIFFSFLMMLSRCSNSSFLLPHTTSIPLSCTCVSLSTLRAVRNAHSSCQRSVSLYAVCPRKKTWMSGGLRRRRGSDVVVNAQTQVSS